MSDNKETKQAPAVEAASVEHGQMGWKLAMRVMQSDLFEQLDDAERAECDALVRANPYMNFRSNADSAPAPAVEAAQPAAGDKQESNSSAYQRGYLDGMAKGKRDAAADEKDAAPSVAQGERGAFEYIERASYLERDDEGDYVNPCVQSAWEGFQKGCGHARAASTPANVAQWADWLDRELNIHPVFEPLYAPFAKLWEQQVPTSDMKSLCFFFYRHGAQKADVSQGSESTDDIAVDSFAREMKAKMAQARENGRSGWEGCDPADLSRMLREHVEKGDPRDVANYCMMLWHHSAGIAAPTPVADGGAMDDLRAIQRVLRELDPKWRERGEFGVVAREQIIAAIHYLAATQPASEPGAAVAAIRYALNADEGIEFLRCWQHGQFDVCRNEWPDAPKECYAGADPLLAMMPQPASEQQPVPQLFADTGDAVRGTFGKTVFAGMSNSDDLWPVWLDGWLRASEQQAARVLSDEQRRILLRVSECLYVAGYQMLSGELASAFSAILAAKGDGHA